MGFALAHRSSTGRPVSSRIPHLETFISSVTGEPITVGCGCAINESHSYSDWQEAIARREIIQTRCRSTQRA